MRMKTMKKNIKLKKNIRKYGRIAYLSSKNGLNSVFPVFINNLYFFDSKKSNIWYSKTLVFLKIILINYIYIRSLSQLTLNSIFISSNFSKDASSKSEEISSSYINNKKNKFFLSSFSIDWENVYNNNMNILDSIDYFDKHNECEYNELVNYNFYSEYFFIYNYTNKK